MRSLARNISSETKMSTIFNDLLTNDESLSRPTIEQYIAALKKIFVIEDLPAWSAKLRSKTAIRTSSKWHFIDPSIATAALRATPERLLDDFETFGFLFESLAIRDLRVYAESMDGKVYHYRDKNRLEVDAIIQLGDGRWGAAEIKMGAGMIEKAAANLLAFKDKIDNQNMKTPSFLMVLTATESAFQMKNGVWVVPLGCLRN
jgi:predicted AAA+ superfamily ATPase